MASFQDVGTLLVSNDFVNRSKVLLVNQRTSSELLGVPGLVQGTCHNSSLLALYSLLMPRYQLPSEVSGYFWIGHVGKVFSGED